MSKPATSTGHDGSTPSVNDGSIERAISMGESQNHRSQGARIRRSRSSSIRRTAVVLCDPKHPLMRCISTGPGSKHWSNGSRNTLIARPDQVCVGITSTPSGDKSIGRKGSDMETRPDLSRGLEIPQVKAPPSLRYRMFLTSSGADRSRTRSQETVSLCGRSRRSTARQHGNRASIDKKPKAPEFCWRHLMEGIGIRAGCPGDRMFVTISPDRFIPPSFDGSEEVTFSSAQGNLTASLTSKSIISDQRRIHHVECRPIRRVAIIGTGDWRELGRAVPCQGARRHRDRYLRRCRELVRRFVKAAWPALEDWSPPGAHNRVSRSRRICRQLSGSGLCPGEGPERIDFRKALSGSSTNCCQPTSLSLRVPRA